MTIEQEMFELPNLKHVGIALVQFVYSLHGGKFKKKTDWVYTTNFIAIAIHYKRVEKIQLNLKCCPADVEEREILPLYSGRWNYTRCEITSPRQLACASRYIQACYDSWYRDIFGK